MEEPQLVERIVRIVLTLNKQHWLRHGTPIKPEDAAAVTLDVLGRLSMEALASETAD